MHEVLVNRVGGLSLPRKSVVRLTDRPDMTLDVYRGRKTTIQHQIMAKNCNKKGGVTDVVFKISDLENVNFASCSARRYNGVLWKTHFFATSLLHKNFHSEKTGHNVLFKN